MQDIRARIQRKLQKQSSLSNDSVVSLAQQTRRKLQKMFSEYEDIQQNRSIVSTPEQVTKYNNKFEDMDYLHQAKNKINELQNTNQRLNMRLLESDKHILAFKEKLDEEKRMVRDREDKIVERNVKEKEEMRGDYQTKLQKNLKYIDDLLEQKSKYNQQIQTFILQKRKLEKALSQQKQKTRIQVKSKLQAFQATEKQKRTKWQQRTRNEIKQNTIKGMQPELNSIITRTRNEIKQVEQRCQLQKQQHRNECYKDFERRVIEFKEQAFREHEIEKERLRVEYSTKLKEQYDKLEGEFAGDRQKMRQGYKGEIDQQKIRRKNEQEEFMRKRRVMDSEHMDEIKRIRDDYQERIRYLEGGRDVYLQSEKERLEGRYRTTLQEEIEKIRKEQKEKSKTIYQKLSQTFQAEKQQYIAKISEMNADLQRDLQIKFQAKRKDERRLFEDQLKKSKRDVAVLEQKLQRLGKTSGDMTKEKDQFEGKYMELKVKYDELYQVDKEGKLKIKELEKKLDGLKGEMEGEGERRVKEEVGKREKELGVMRGIIEKQEEDRVLINRRGEQKVKESEKRWAEEMLELEKRARKVLDKKEVEIDGLKKEIKKKEQVARQYERMLEKQRQQLMASLYK